MKMIPLSQGKFAKVDDDDFEWLSQWSWHCKDGYATRSSPIFVDIHRRPIYMHRVIVFAPKDKVVDHIDGDTLNNSKSNLRICTVRENSGNRKISKNNACGYKGVHFNKMSKKWQATLQVKSKKVYLGVYDTPEMAAQAYDEAAKKEFGEFARTNFL